MLPNPGTEVLRSDKFHYENRRNRTLECIQREFVASMNLCSNHSDPELQGYTLHCCIDKGDWKHKKDWLQACRHFSNVSAKGGGSGPGKGLICPRCYAGGPGRSWACAKEPWNNAADLRAAAATSSLAIGQHVFRFQFISL